MRNTLALAGALAAASCVNIDLDNNEMTAGATGAIVEFDPGKSIVPFPNNLLIDRGTGKVNLPAQCGESATSATIRTLVLNGFDGFGTFKSAQRITLTEPVDMASVAGNIVMYPRAEGARELPAAESMAKQVPLVAIPGKTVRFSPDCSTMATVDSLTLVPARPLAARTTYVVAVLKGLKGTSGATLGASSTWGLVRLKNTPVVVENGDIISERTPLNPSKPEDKATLLGLDLLWKAHAKALLALDAITSRPREDIVLAWEFITHTTTAPLDPAVAGSPAAGVPRAAISTVTTTAANSTAAVGFMTTVLQAGGAPATICDAPPAGLGCASIGKILDGQVTSPNYQSPGTNTGFPAGGTIPGPWSSAVTPLRFGNNTVATRIYLPATTMPATGWPTILFGHGLGSNRETLAAIASQLARAGFASVSVDFVAHGGRAVRTSNSAALGCADGTGRPNPAQDPQCYAPFLTTVLPTTRDNVRQTVLDLQTVVQSLKLCTSATACANGGDFLQVDPAKIGYLGISLGSIIGATTVAVTPDIKAAVLSVGGAGWVDVFENTGTPAIRCTVVNGLIDAGIIVGGVKAPPPFTDMNATCNKANDPTKPDDHWTEQPGYQTFANIARWILDPADGANFAARLGVPTRRVLNQRVEGDTVVPNLTTNTLAALSGHMMPTNADEATPATTTASAPILVTTAGMVNKWLNYRAIDAAGGNPGNKFTHSSLLSPSAADGVAGQLGTRRMQLDAITYLNIFVNN